MKPASEVLRVAFGPIMDGWGSWDWCGADVALALQSTIRTTTFGPDERPVGDVIVYVKHPPATLPEGGTRLIYAPVDFFGHAGEIDRLSPFLSRCSRIVVHCERLRKYFTAYAPVEYMDHHVKFVAPTLTGTDHSGPLLWVGVRTNLPPLVEWVNQHGLPRELIVLTNPEQPGRTPAATSFGFKNPARIRIAQWSPESHVEWLQSCSAAIDVKADDFRSRHKPPAKAIDFLASGLPLAMPPTTSSVEHLAGLGFDVAQLGDWDRLFSHDYRHETLAFGAVLRELLSLPRIARRWLRILFDAAR